MIGGENSGGMAQVIEVYRTNLEGFDAATIPMTVITDTQHYMHRSFHTANFVPERKYIYLVGGFGPTNHSELQGKIGVFSVVDESFVAGAVGFNAETARVAHTATTLDPGIPKDLSRTSQDTTKTSKGGLPCNKYQTIRKISRMPKDLSGSSNASNEAPKNLRRSFRDLPKTSEGSHKTS